MCIRDRHHALEALGGFRLRRSGGCEMRTAGHRLRNHINNSRMRVPLNQRAERHHEIDVLVPVEIPDVRSAATLQYNRPRRCLLYTSLFVGCGKNKAQDADTALELIEIQLEGKRRMTAQEFINGYRPKSGDHLGQ